MIAWGTCALFCVTAGVSCHKSRDTQAAQAAKAGSQRGADSTVVCSACGGSGTVAQKCPYCSGKGYQGTPRNPQTCIVCNGTGKQLRKCERCGGSGKILAPK
jgi:DnaJ-class molecular chaperone